MTETTNLETLYQDARTACKAKDYDRASDLLRQILVVDENYKDASRLLAQVVRYKRRRWYTDPRLLAAVGIAAVILLVVGLASRTRGILITPVPAASTDTPSAVLPTMSIDNMTVVPSLLPTSTPIPLAWKRLSLGQEFPRDTITVIETDPNDPDVIYVGMQRAGIYKSINGGISWQSANKGIDNAQVHTLVMDPQDSRILFAGTEGGIYKTTDRGENWSYYIAGKSFFIDPQNPLLRYSVNVTTIYGSMDGGNAWTQNYDGSSCPERFNFLFSLHPFQNNVLFASQWDTTARCKAGLYKSVDGGRTWSLTGLEKDGLLGFGVAKDEKGGFVIFVKRMAGDSMAGLYISRDNGLTWEHSTQNESETIAVDLLSPNTMYVGSKQIAVTRDSGRSWRQLAPLDINTVSAIHTDSHGGIHRIIAGGSGIDVSFDNGATWMNRSNGLGAMRLDMKINPWNGSIAYVAAYPYYYPRECKLFRSDNAGMTWSKLPLSAYADWCGPSFDAEGALYSLQDWELKRSRDQGATWITLPSPPQQGKIDGMDANPFLVGHLYSASETAPHVSYSDDSGRSWQVSGGLNNDSGGGWYVNRFFFVPPEGKLLYAVGESIFRSADEGRNWQACQEVGMPVKSDSRLAIDPLDGNHLFIAMQGNGINVSVNGCMSWETRNNGLGSPFINTIAIDPSHPNSIYAGADDGSYVSFDNGEIWNKINDGLLGTTIVYSIVVDPQSNVYAATPNGIFKLEPK
jgi:photosystem II stability/assembly factor-like uncharacterized protein